MRIHWLCIFICFSIRTIYELIIRLLLPNRALSPHEVLKNNYDYIIHGSEVDPQLYVICMSTLNTKVQYTALLDGWSLCSPL